MKLLKKEIVTKLAYMTGVRDIFLERNYEPDCPEIMAQIRECKEAKIVRILCRIRTVIMLNYERVNTEIRYDMKNLDRMEIFDTEDIKWLEANGVRVLQVNSSADKYLVKVSQLIGKHINDCKNLFPQWASWEYIKELFVIPGSLNANEQVAIKAIKNESKLFSHNSLLYPFQSYIHWEPEDCGNIFNSDKKFLDITYRKHGEVFDEENKVTDAADETKENIYDFIDDSDNIVIVVDCENADVYKLYSVLKGLDEETIGKIKKIILYDDVHTTPAWRLLRRFVNIEVEHIEVPRVTDRKSLVDQSLTVGVCREYFRNRIDSFILFSSDSDFWGLIRNMPEAHFIVMIEYEKCGAGIKRVLTENEIYYCSVDDFCADNTEDIQTIALCSALKEHLAEFNENGVWNELDMNTFVDSLYSVCRINPKPTERKRFTDKYIRTLRFGVGENGRFGIFMK